MAQIKCSFCSKTQDKVKGMVQGADENIYICDECINLCVDIIQDIIDENEETDVETKGNFKPSIIKKHLDNYIIGQERAKKILGVAVYNHYKIIDRILKKKSDDIEVEKSNIMLIGPSGSGKTAMIKALAKILDVPLAISDASTLTAAGYVGEDPENIIRRLIENANGDIERAERGIVYIDEIDKISRKSENPSLTRDVSGEDVQKALLTIVEGSVIEVPEKMSRKHPLKENMKINTENILFICGGAFDGLIDIIKQRQKNTNLTMGFGAKIESKEEKSLNNYIHDTKIEDLFKYGMINEFLGRFPIICTLSELSEQELVKILTEPKNALIKQYQILYDIDGIKLDFTEDSLKAIAKKAIERKTGARSLRSIIEEVLLEYSYHLPDKEEIEKLTITEEIVENTIDHEIKEREIV